jgi:hypothetical protein
MPPILQCGLVLFLLGCDWNFDPNMGDSCLTAPMASTLVSCHTIRTGAAGRAMGAEVQPVLSALFAWIPAVGWAQAYRAVLAARAAPANPISVDSLICKFMSIRC